MFQCMRILEHFILLNCECCLSVCSAGVTVHVLLARRVKLQGSTKNLDTILLPVTLLHADQL